MLELAPTTLLIHRLLTLPGVYPEQLRKCVERLGSVVAVWEASVEQLQQTGLQPATAQRLVSERTRQDLAQVEAKLHHWHTSIGLQLIDQEHAYYPRLLLEIPDAPLLLYVRGSVEALAGTRLLAIVGSRTATTYGRQVINTAVPDLVSANVTIVSGLAFGIDALAHQATLDHQGTTIAVLGSSIAPVEIMPGKNQPLAKAIIDGGGVLVSEYPPGTATQSYQFPQRNRLIAGMSQATLVVEAAAKSGSLITSQLALDYNRDVLAVPGSILSPMSEGTNQLIVNGARPWISCQSLFDTVEYWNGHQPIPAAAPRNLSADEHEVYSLLSHEPQGLNDLADRSTLATAAVISIMMQLLIKGHAVDIGGQRFVKQ